MCSGPRRIVDPGLWRPHKRTDRRVFKLGCRARDLLGVGGYFGANINVGKQRLEVYVRSSYSFTVVNLHLWTRGN